MVSELRYYYKEFRIVLVNYHSLTGGVVVQFRTPKGTWNIIDKIGFFSLLRREGKFYFNSKKLGFWLNQGAFFGRAARRLFLAFCSVYGVFLAEKLLESLKKNKQLD